MELLLRFCILFSELTAHNILQILLDREDAIRFNTSPSTQATESVATPSTLSPSTLNLRDGELFFNVKIKGNKNKSVSNFVPY